jgi:hypothetical protein
MKLPGIAGNVKKLLLITVKIMVADNGVHLHHRILQVFVPNLNGPRIDSAGIKYNPFDLNQMGETHPNDQHRNSNGTG